MANKPGSDPGIEDAKPLLPGVGVLIDTEKLVGGADDPYYIVVYGKRYYGTTPETTVANVRELARGGIIKAPVKGLSWAEKARASVQNRFTRKPKPAGAEAAPRNTTAKTWRNRLPSVPSWGKKSSGPAKAPAPSNTTAKKSWKNRLPSVPSWGKKTPAGAPPPAPPTPPKQTNKYQKLGSNTPVTGAPNREGNRMYTPPSERFTNDPVTPAATPSAGANPQKLSFSNAGAAGLAATKFKAAAGQNKARLEKELTGVNIPQSAPGGKLNVRIPDRFGNNEFNNAPGAGAAPPAPKQAETRAATPPPVPKLPPPPPGGSAGYRLAMEQLRAAEAAQAKAASSSNLNQFGGARKHKLRTVKRRNPQSMFA